MNHKLSKPFLFAVPMNLILVLTLIFTSGASPVYGAEHRIGSAHISFTEHTLQDGYYAMSDVLPVDLDKDGDNDVLTTSYSGAYWLENDGDQNFTEHIIQYLRQSA